MWHRHTACCLAMSICMTTASLSGRSYNLVLEFLGKGDLFDTLHRVHHGRIPEAEVASRVARPLLEALEHMHSQQVLHRDIKARDLCPSHILLTHRMYSPT